MLAVDDGLAQGNLDVADVFFLIGTIIGFIAAFLWARPPVGSRINWGPPLLCVAVACLGFGFFLL